MSESTPRFFSPEWFRAEAVHYADFEAETKEQLAWFQSQYGPDQLRALSGKELLTALFYNDSDKKENLCYDLEMNAKIKSNFGSISGGSAFKFGLFFHKQKLCWMTGSANKPKQLTEEEAIALGTEIRDQLVAGAEEIAKFGPLNATTDYEMLYEKVRQHIRLDNIWILKYYKMIFPELFHSAYSEDQQRHMLYALQIQPHENQFVRMGQIALFSKECGIPCEVLGKAFSDAIGWYKPIYRIGTGDAGDSDFTAWRKGSYCALGFRELGNYDQYLDEKGKADKEKIADALFEQNDSYNKSTASRKANEIVDFIDAENDVTIVTAMNGHLLFGIGILHGAYYYDETIGQFPNKRQTEWRFISENGIRLPVFEGRLTSFTLMDDEKNMMLIYKLLYHQGQDTAEAQLETTDLLDEEESASNRERFAAWIAPVLYSQQLPCSEKDIERIYLEPLNKTTINNGANSIWTCTDPKVVHRLLTSALSADGHIHTYQAMALNRYLEYLKKEAEQNSEDDTPKAWLLTWHPNNWTWTNYEKAITQATPEHPYEVQWSCANSHAKPGDYAFLRVSGAGVNSGIIAFGVVTSESFLAPHWDEQKRAAGKTSRRVKVEFSKIVDHHTSVMITTQQLKALYPDQIWAPMSSGIEVRYDYAKELAEMLAKEEEVQPNPIRFVTGYSSPYDRNRIIFGAPGTGKSYTLNSEKDILLSDGGAYERVTFHPDYTYAHFVGTYKPVPCQDQNGNDAITYKYVPGPFMRTYVKALRNSREETPLPFLLIIEEINRANVAAVFGDIFQLLDRDDDETSEYAIQATEDMKRYLADELGGQPDDYAEIRLPDNFFIWATMNSADQGVFPMDTAFKRRWNFTYLNINAGEASIAGKKVVLGNGGYQRDVEWNELRKAINDRLSSFRVNEDKLLGPFFLSKKVIPAAGEIDPARFMDAFKNKVLMYLYDDAAKQKRASLFASDVDTTKYSAVCDAFDERGVCAFCTEISCRFQPTDGDEA